MSHLPGLRSADETLKWMRDSVFAGQDVLVVELDGVVVGYASFTGKEISNMYVLPGYQGRGIGAALLAAVLRSMPSEAELWVFESNAGAIRFYERNGFETVATTSGDNEEGLPDRLMRRRL
jgi:ribosomal protein S18 acetylase RimI-like enzyme